MKRSAWGAMATALLIVAAMNGSVHAQVPIVWDGGNGNWEDANWNDGQLLEIITGDVQGTPGGHDIEIGGAEVFYDAALIGDFRPRKENGPASVTIKDGASLELNTFDSDEDGIWTQFDADLILDGGTLKRTLTTGGSSLSGGLHMFGSWRSVQDQRIDVILKNGGRFENDGQLWFGADEEHALGLKVGMVIDDGSLDLTGGTFPQDNNENFVEADLAFFYGTDQGDGDGATGTGLPKGEEYTINFKGPGSITVDQAGIWVYDQAETSIWTATQSTYEDLWDRGILRSDGVSGGYIDPVSGLPNSTNLAFSNFFTVTGSSGADDYTVTRKDPTVVTWDGGAGEWNDDAKWNGGQTATAAMGTDRGSDGGHAIVIDGSLAAGTDVTFDPNPGTGADNDFRMRVDNGVSSLTIQNGATFELHTASDTDGKWTRWGADLNVDGEGSVFRRTKDNVNSFSGGVLLFGAFNQQMGQEIDINLTNGGRLENDGEVYFGRDGGDNAAGLSVTVTINDGTMDLFGGDAIEGGFGIGNGSNSFETEVSVFLEIDFSPSLMFYFSNRDVPDNEGPAGPADEEYVINFTGPGSITVDHAGIYTVVEDELGLVTADAKTYEDLWADGILQANGLSGLDDANFGDFFSVTGELFSDDYTLTSLIGAVGLDGDYNNDGKVDAADYTVWRDNVGAPAGTLPNDADGGVIGSAQYDTWKANFGNMSGAGGAAAVPEPSTIVLALGMLIVGLAVRRTRG